MPTLYEVIKEQNLGVQIVKEYPRDDDTFTEITFECQDAGDLMMLAYRMGFYDLNKGIVEEAIPKMMGNVERIITEITKTCEN